MLPEQDTPEGFFHVPLNELFTGNFASEILCVFYMFMTFVLTEL